VAGDIVLFGKYTGTELKRNEIDYVFMREEDIFGVLT
jgi:co-chaperonin GroES (HSP10)